MFDKITLDKETFKVLSADTRIEILKRLEQHKETLTDIAEGLDMSPSTIKEHLDKLSQADLIEQIASDTKWKYYKLTKKGKKILSPYETNVLILLAASFVLLTGSLYSLTSKIVGFTKAQEHMVFTAPAPEAARELSKGAAQAVSIPYLEISLVVLSAVLFGVLLGRLIRK